MIILSAAEARAFMIQHHRLDQFHYQNAQDLPNMLEDLRCIQLDPLSPFGTSPDLAALARCERYQIGDLFGHCMPEHSFEHFAKERCLLPASMFPYYRDRAIQAPWWNLSARLKKVSPEMLQAVLDELTEIGPASPSQLKDHGRVIPMDWSGWKGTAKATTMALEILWTRCEVVVAGRNGREKVYDIPQRALPSTAKNPGGDFDIPGILARVDAAGLLPRNAGPHWSMLKHLRKAPLIEELIEDKQLVEVQIENQKPIYLARPSALNRPITDLDDHMRILGPLDAILWSRKLIEHIFDFEYVWEVYKPAAKRRWGWYVCPILHRGQLVGRLEGHMENDKLIIDTVWNESNASPDRDALKTALNRLCAANGITKFKLPSRFRKAVT